MWTGVVSTNPHHHHHHHRCFALPYRPSPQVRKVPVWSWVLSWNRMGWTDAWQ